MVKQRTRELPSTLDPVKAIPILERLVVEAEQLRSEAWTSTARQQWAHTGEGALIAALGSAHPSVQAFGTAQCGAFGPDDTEGELLQQANRQLDGMVAVLKSTIEQLRWHLPDPTHIFLPAGSQHDAFVEIRSIVSQATSEIFVVDPYVDHTLWILLTNVSDRCTIRVLTENMKADFALEAKKFSAQHKSGVEVRRTTNYHDRFIILDGSRCFHLGASIKDAGAKTCALSEMQRASIAAAAIGDAETAWKQATPVPL